MTGTYNRKRYAELSGTEPGRGDSGNPQKKAKRVPDFTRPGSSSMARSASDNSSKFRRYEALAIKDSSGNTVDDTHLFTESSRPPLDFMRPQSPGIPSGKDFSEEHHHFAPSVDPYDVIRENVRHEAPGPIDHPAFPPVPGHLQPSATWPPPLPASLYASEGGTFPLPPLELYGDLPEVPPSIPSFASEGVILPPPPLEGYNRPSEAPLFLPPERGDRSNSGNMEVSLRNWEKYPGFRDFEVGPIFDMPFRAKEIRFAIKHESKEHIYCGLQKMQREIATIDELKDEYRVNSERRRYLDGDVKKRLGIEGVSSDYVDQLLGKEVPIDSPYRLEPPPRHEGDYGAIAHRVRDAIGSNIVKADMEIIYSALTPLGRRIESISMLENTYHEVFKEDLRSTVRMGLVGPARDYTLYLLGEKKMETPFFTEVEADRLATTLSRMTFTDNNGMQRPIPFKYIGDGCYYRAYVMNQAIAEMGFASDCISIDVRGTSQSLNVESNLSRDTESSQPSTAWGYHITPLIKVQSQYAENGQPAKVENNVLDPPIPQKRLKIDRWAKHMGNDYHQISLGDYINMRKQNQPPLRDQAVVFVAPRHLLDPDTVLNFTQNELESGKMRVVINDTWTRYKKFGISALTEFSKKEKSYQYASSLRSALGRNAMGEIQKTLVDLSYQPEEMRMFRDEFPILFQDVHLRSGMPFPALPPAPFIVLPERDTHTL